MKTSHSRQRFTFLAILSLNLSCFVHTATISVTAQSLSIPINAASSAPSFTDPLRQVYAQGRAVVYLGGQSDTPPPLEIIATNNLEAVVAQSAAVPNGSSSMTARAQGILLSRSFFFEGSQGIAGNLGSGVQPYVDVYSGANAQLSFTVDQDTPFTLTCDVWMTDETGDPQKTFTAVQGNIEILESGSILLNTYLDRQSFHLYTNSVFLAGRSYRFSIGCNGYIRHGEQNYSGSAGAFFRGSLAIVPALQVSLLRSELSLRWPTNYTSYVLESASSTLDSWTPHNTPPNLNGGFYEIRASSAGPKKFYRLRKS